MKLLTEAVKKKLPALYAMENESDPQVVVKFFNPCGAATWYITEGSPEGDDFVFFGLCDLGMGFPELGYVSLSELESVKLPFGLGIERDLHWTPVPLSRVMEKVGA